MTLAFSGNKDDFGTFYRGLQCLCPISLFIFIYLFIFLSRHLGMHNPPQCPHWPSGWRWGSQLTLSFLNPLSAPWSCSHQTTKLSTTVLYSVSSPLSRHSSIAESSENFQRWHDSKQKVKSAAEKVKRKGDRTIHWRGLELLNTVVWCLTAAHAVICQSSNQ